MAKAATQGSVTHNSSTSLISIMGTTSAKRERYTKFEKVCCPFNVWCEAFTLASHVILNSVFAEKYQPPTLLQYN